MTREEVLVTEYSDRFDELRKNRMVFSYPKYGPIRTNYGQGYIDAVASLEKSLELYKETGNAEHLCDLSNFAMIEFMYPHHKDAHFKTINNGERHIVGMGINEMERFKEESQE